MTATPERRPGTRPRGDPFDVDGLRAALRAQPSATSSGERPPGDDELIRASVLFPIVRHVENASVLLTQRAENLRDHAGQISFPGGRVEAGDGSPMQTALREAREEIGLSPECAEIVGYLPDYRTMTGFCITPVVALLTPPLELSRNPHEVADIFEVPLAFLLDPANHRQRAIPYRGELRCFHAMPYGKRNIWGATAGIIRMLYQALNGHCGHLPRPGRPFTDLKHASTSPGSPP